MKRTFLLLLVTLPTLGFACRCGITHTFCEIYQDGPEASVFAIDLSGFASHQTTYYDVPIIGHYFGPELEFDSLTVFNWTGCAVPMQFLADTLILQMRDFEKYEDSNYPVYTFFECGNDFVRYSNDSISYYAVRRGIHMVREANSTAFSEFLKDYGSNCSESANPDDLVRLKGVEVVQNPIFEHLKLRNNLDNDITYTIYDVNGRYFSNGMVSANSIKRHEVHNFATGVYYVRIDDGIGTKFIKVLKL